MKNKVEIGRLALRKEGEFWNAYWSSSQHNLDKALLIGCIRLNCMTDQIRIDFMELMKESFAVMVENITGETPTWSEPRTAPEDEKGGNA